MTVSYLIINYNKQDFIKGVIDAVFAEHSATGGEIIVYDDCSTDNSVQVLQQHIANNTKQAGIVNIVRGDINRGVGQATNKIIELAKQPFIRLIDGDDIIIKGSTQKFLEHMEKYKLGFVFGQVTEVGSNDDAYERQSFEPLIVMQNPLHEFLKHTLAGPSPSLFVADVLRRAVPVPEWIRRTQDFIINIRVANHGVRIGYVNDVVALRPADRGSNNLSTSLAAMFAEMSRDVAHDGNDLPIDDLRYVARRYAGRTAKYFRRRGQSRLTAREKFDLLCWQRLPWPVSRQACIDRLNTTAGMLERDRHVLITASAAA